MVLDLLLYLVLGNWTLDIALLTDGRNCNLNTWHTMETFVSRVAGDFAIGNIFLSIYYRWG